MGQIGTECVPNGKSGHSCAFATEVSRWQGNSLTPGSHLAQAYVPGQSLSSESRHAAWCTGSSLQHTTPALPMPLEELSGKFENGGRS